MDFYANMDRKTELSPVFDKWGHQGFMNPSNFSSGSELFRIELKTWKDAKMKTGILPPPASSLLASDVSKLISIYTQTLLSLMLSFKKWENLDSGDLCNLSWVPGQS